MSIKHVDAGPGATVTSSILSYERTHVREHVDEIAVEEPMEIRVQTGVGGERHSIAVTMRTPGDDFELAAGFLFSEGIISGPHAIRDISYCFGVPEQAQTNVINVTLARDTPFDPERFTRNVYTSSSCGICGKTSIEMVRAVIPEPCRGDFSLDRNFFLGLEHRMAATQSVFTRTGGLHASALFDLEGNLLLAREDVGRHNALDKLIGSLLLEDRLPASDTVLMLSGRASYELVQKALLAGISAMAAVGAPSSLAVETAREFDLTLIGFLREGRFNVYSGEERVVQ
jgi:FdhD protein